MKYLTIREGNGLEFPVFCAGFKTHEDMAAAWRRDSSGAQVLSAGFCEFTPDGVRTFGRSLGLNLGTRPNDATLIAVFYRHTVRDGIMREPVLPAPNSHFAPYPKL